MFVPFYVFYIHCPETKNDVRGEVFFFFVCRYFKKIEFHHACKFHDSGIIKAIISILLVVVVKIFVFAGKSSKGRIESERIMWIVVFPKN